MRTYLLLFCVVIAIASFAQSNPSSGNIYASGSDCTVTGACVTITFPNNNVGTVGIQVSGTYTGTLQFEGSTNNGKNVQAINCTPTNSTVAATSTTSTGVWRCPVSGLNYAQVRGSALASGQASVNILASSASASLSGGAGLNPLGTANDVVCVNGVNSIGPCDTGNLNYASSTLSTPNLVVGPGTPNEGTTGTDLNKTAVFVNTGGVVQLRKCTTTDKKCFLVVKESSCAGGTSCTTGNAWVQGAFTETDTFSNTAVVGNWFKASTTSTDGQVADTGVAATSPCPAGVTCLGFAMTAGSGAQTVVRTVPNVGYGSSDVVGLFTSCSGTQYLGADGACHTAGGGDTYTGYAFNLSAGVYTAGTNGFISPYGSQSGGVQTSLAAASPVGKTGTIGNLYVHLSNALPANCFTTVAIAWCTGAGCTPADTTVTCQVASGARDCSDTTHFPSVTAGDYVNIHVTNTQSGGTCTAQASSFGSVFHVQ